MNLRCLIVDDEPNAVSLLEMFIRQNTVWQLVGKCYDAPEALSFLKTHPVDLIFLDINMPHLTGMEMAALLPPSTSIVFTTAYSEYAADSYSFPTIDYLLKPITLKRFYAALQKIEAHFARPEAAAPVADNPPAAAPRPETEYFFIKSGRMLHKVLLQDILYFEGEKEYARLVTPTQRLLIYRRLKDIGEQLSGSFARVHNSYIVNIARLDSIRDNHVFIGSKQIPISEKFREAFMERIKEKVF
ncbi:LytR/AlgR family response regulator transcription factor [Puia dinghuensis]|uniref:DNA-binding response regulator n=1 Tax=Puia dinghuensis TaxID=1792502 RepID=A0A8J2XPT7_9BACT|nr:LytTR family DNA-binding domain-containing protein [Puia dinghuensis]GGA89207.1 DNA-binding response regulator [Puia dinghuensis]